MKYQSIRLVVGEDFKELCHTHELDVEPIHCFSVQTTVQDILSFMYETKDMSTLAIFAYVVVEWLKGRKGRTIRIGIENEKIKEISAENISKKELEDILKKAVMLTTHEPDDQ